MGAQMAPDDVVRRREDVNGGREPLLVLDPLIEFLDAHGLGEGEPEIAPLGDGHSNPTYAVTRGELSCRAAPPAAPAAIRSPPTTSCARRGCCARCRPPAHVCRGCWPSARTSPCWARRSTSRRWSRARSSRQETPPALDTPEQHVRIADEIVDALVEIHAVDWRAAGLEDFGKPAGYTERQVRRFSGLLEEYRTRDIPALDRMTQWLQTQHPGDVGDHDRPRRLPARERHVRA